jgi:hypothetical protein
MTHSTPSVFDLICAGKLRAGSYVTYKLPHKRGICKGVLQSNGEIAFGIGGISTLFTLNKFAEKVSGYRPNGWKTVFDEHDVLLDKVREKYRTDPTRLPSPTHAGGRPARAPRAMPAPG